MNCDCPKEIPDDELGGSLCKSCRRKALSSIRTRELLRVIERLKVGRSKAIRHFREILPELIDAAEVLNKSRLDQSLEDGEREAAKRTWGVYLFAVNAVDIFEINETLKERAGRG